MSVIDAKDAPSRARKLVKNGSVIYSTVRPYLLNIAIVDREFDPEPIVSTAFAVLHPFEGVYNKFLYYYLRSKPFIAFVESEMTGMAYPAISDSKLNKGLFPLPPLAEQKRIVERVENLLNQTRRLQTTLAEASATAVHLHHAAIHELLTAVDPTEFNGRWQFLADNFATLYDESCPDAALSNLAALKQAILQLAVQGKLTRQDPADEPTSALLTRISEEKKRLGIKSMELAEIGEGERPFALPDGWKWTRIGDVFVISSGTTPSRNRLEYFENGSFNWVKTTDLNNNFVTSCEEMITKEAVRDYNLKIYPRGSIGIAMYGGAGTIGKTGILDIETTLNQSVCGLFPSPCIEPEYLHYYLKSIRSRWMDFAAGLRKAPNINAGIIKNMVFPVPPLAEQKRIVARVQDLLALCDQLAVQITASQQTRIALRDAVLVETG